MEILFDKAERIARDVVEEARKESLERYLSPVEYY